MLGDLSDDLGLDAHEHLDRRGRRRFACMRDHEWMSEIGTLHHVELRTADLDVAIETWGWLLDELGFEAYQEWSGGRSWRRAATYIVLESAPASGAHDRREPGLSHLAFHGGTPENVERLWATAPDHGWAHLYADRWPWAGGPGHYAAFLENAERFKVELVASADQTMS